MQGYSVSVLDLRACVACEMSAVGQMEGEKCERRQTFFPINFLWSILIIETLIARNCFKLLMEEPTASFTTRNLKVASVDHCLMVQHSYILQFLEKMQFKDESSSW